MYCVLAVVLSAGRYFPRITDDASDQVWDESQNDPFENFDDTLQVSLSYCIALHRSATAVTVSSENGPPPRAPSDSADCRLTAKLPRDSETSTRFRS